MNVVRGLRAALGINGLILATSLLWTAHGSAVVAKTGETAYAVVDMQAVILNVADGKNARSDLEKEIKGKESELQQQKDELDKLNKDWKTQAPLLSEEARLKKQQDFQEKFLNLRNQEMTFQAEIKRKEQKATQKIAAQVSELVNTIAKDRGFLMVFETNSAGLIYLKDPVDLTKDVIASYEEWSKTVKKGEEPQAKKVDKPK